MDEPITTPAENVVAVEDNSQPALPASEPTTSEPVSPEQPTETVTDDTAQAPAEEPVAAEPERQPSRAERVIRQKDGEIKRLSAELQKYAEQQSNTPIPQPEAAPVPKLSELLSGKESIDPSELDEAGNRLVEQTSKTQAGYTALQVQQLRNERIQERAVDNYTRDEAVLPNLYPELNADNPGEYDPVLDEKIAKTWQRMAVKPNPTPQNPNGVWIDPNVKLADVAKDLVELARASAERGKTKTSATLATQVDNSAVTPTSDTPAEKTFEDMTLQEQEAYLRSKGHDI